MHTYRLTMAALLIAVALFLFSMQAMAMGTDCPPIPTPCVTPPGGGGELIVSNPVYLPVVMR